MSDQKPDMPELLANSIAREETLCAYLAESNQARYKLQNEVEEQEQEIADLNREIAQLKIDRDAANKRWIGVDFNKRLGRVSWISNWIKRLAK